MENYLQNDALTCGYGIGGFVGLVSGCELSLTQTYSRGKNDRKLSRIIIKSP